MDGRQILDGIDNDRLAHLLEVGQIGIWELDIAAQRSGEIAATTRSSVMSKLFRIGATTPFSTTLFPSTGTRSEKNI